MKVAAVLSLAAGTAGLRTAVAEAGTHAKPPVVLDGHICTKVATAAHPKVTGRSVKGKPAVVCGLSGNDTLKAKGSGTVILIAGRGHDTLIGANNPGAHDILIGGSGSDTFEAGNQGDDVIETQPGDTIDCSTGAATVIAGDEQGDNENGDCQGSNVEDATQEWQGIVTATDGSTTLTISWTDVNDEAQAWLDAQAPADPATATFDISTAIIAGPLTIGEEVEVQSNPSDPNNLSTSTLIAVAVEAEQGNDITCSGTLTGIVQGSVSIPGGSCTLSGATVEGDLKVSGGGSLSASNSTLDGDLASVGAGAVTLTSSNVQGDLRVERNTGAVNISNSTVEGDLDVSNNTGGVTINSNTVDGDLNCASNTPAPTGSGNTVSGSANGQCAGF